MEMSKYERYSLEASSGVSVDSRLIFVVNVCQKLEL